MAARFEVWNRANTTKVADLTTSTDNLIDFTGDDPLNDQGGAEFRLQLDHPQVAQVQRGRCVRLYDGTDLLGTWSIREVERVEVAANDADQVVQVSCVGLLGRLEEGLVRPWIDGRPISRDRVFNWTNPDLSTGSPWSSTVYNQTWANSQWPRLPEGWPKDTTTATQWIWSSAELDVQPVGISLFRRAFTLAEPATVAFYVAANSTFELWADSVLLDREPNKQPDRTGYESTRRYVVSFAAGTHHIAASVENWGGSESDNPAGLALSAWMVESDELQDLLFTTRAADSAWRSLDYPSVFPSRSFPEILAKLLAECQANDELVGWTIDDGGEVYDDVEEFVCRVGATLWEVVEAGAATYVDVWADPEGLVLHVVPKASGRGGPTSVEIESGVNLTGFTTVVSDEFYNRASGVWREGVRVRQNATSIAAHGVRPKSFDLGTVSNRRAVDQILDAYLDAYSEPVESLVVSAIAIDGARLGIDYGTGDTIDVDGETLRCVGATWKLETGAAEGEVGDEPEFQSTLDVRQQERLRAVERMVARFDAPATASILDQGTSIPFGRIGTTRESYSWSGDIEETLDTDDPDNPWQPFRVDRTQRIYGFRAEIPAEYVPDATDDTVIQLLVNGSAIATLTLEVADAAAEVDLPPDTVVLPKDLISVRCTSAGGHVDGSIDILMADPV